MRNANKVHRERLTINERIATSITQKIGSMWAAYLFGALTLLSLPAVLLSGDTVVIVAWVTQTFLQLVLLPISQTHQPSNCSPSIATPVVGITVTHQAGLKISIGPTR